MRLRPHHHPRPDGDDPEESYYAPMADLLAGILFVILVLLMSFAIIHYPDSASVPSSPLAPQTIPAQEPEVDVRARRLLLVEEERAKLIQSIVADLRAESIPARMDLGQGAILLDSPLFRDGAFRLTFSGEQEMMILGRILMRRLACYTPVAACPTPAPVKLSLVFVDVSAARSALPPADSGLDADGFVAARTLALNTALVTGAPALIGLKTDDQSPLIRFQGQNGPGARDTSSVVISFALKERP